MVRGTGAYFWCLKNYLVWWHAKEAWKLVFFSRCFSSFEHILCGLRVHLGPDLRFCNAYFINKSQFSVGVASTDMFTVIRWKCLIWCWIVHLVQCIVVTPKKAYIRMGGIILTNVINNYVWKSGWTIFLCHIKIRKCVLIVSSFILCWLEFERKVASWPVGDDRAHVPFWT